MYKYLNLFIYLYMHMSGERPTAKASSQRGQLTRDCALNLHQAVIFLLSGVEREL